MSRPVPLPRSKNSVDGEPLKCSSPPQSPTQSQTPGRLDGLAPPPVLPKKFIIKRSLGRSESGIGVLEIAKVLPKQSLEDTKALPQKPPKDEAGDQVLDAASLMVWWENVTSWKSLCTELTLRGKRETKIIKEKAEHLYKGIQVYILLVSKHGGFLKEHTAELLCIADNLDKVSKGTKIAGITGGATTVAGGVAAAAGVILSPLTAGVSLALTVIGVGVATAGGITGASAAIANKVNVTMDKKKIEKSFQEYEGHMGEIQSCLKFISDGMGQLKQHNLSILSEVSKDSVRVAKVIQLAAMGGGSARAIEANSKASGLMEGFALGIDVHFTKGKKGREIKKGHESKLAKKIRNLAEDLNKALDELILIKDEFSSLCPVE